jgi:hypothetical protein
MNLVRVFMMLVLVGSTLALAQGAPTVDGRVAAGEYAQTLRHERSGMTISWSIVGDTIFIALQVASRGWMGIGLLAEREDRKKNTDKYIFTMDGGRFTALDMFQVKRTGAPELDTAVGGRNSILQAAGTHDGQNWTVEFSRKLKTGDAADMDIIPGQRFIFMIAVSSRMDIREEHRRTERWEIRNFSF